MATFAQGGYPVALKGFLQQLLYKGQINVACISRRGDRSRSPFTCQLQVELKSSQLVDRVEFHLQIEPTARLPAPMMAVSHHTRD